MTENTNQVFVDDIYQELTNEFEQIRTCLGMYISKDQTEGALHLLKEIVNNALDECTNVNSPSRKVDITLDEETNEFIVADEGRGIPFDMLVKICTVKHTSTKFKRDKTHSKDQAGKNGVGSTVVAALSDYMSISSYRNMEVKTIEFRDGTLKELPLTKLKKDKHGTIVKFMPSEKYLGPIDMTTDLVENYLRCLSYILRHDLKINFYGKKKGLDTLIARTYKSEGLANNVKFLSSSLEFEPVSVTFSNDNFDLDMSFSYDKTLDETILNSYCNYVITSEGGNHEIASQRAICEFLSREGRKLDPNNKFEITFDDCKKGLIICVNGKHVNPTFEGQHKSKVSNRDFLSDGKKGLSEELIKYFNTNNGLLRKIIGYLRQISKIRLEANKIKGVSIKKISTFLDDAEIPGFYNVSDRSYTGYKELIITEGDSAAGAILNARNSKHQAIFSPFGVLNNIYGLSIEQIWRSKFGNLLKVLGCGIGKEFDINKLKWNKIILCHDSDTDGSNITSLTCCFFLLFLRPLIEAGLIYKAQPPLYLINQKPIQKFYKGDKWLFNKNEYYELFNTLIANNVEISLLSYDSKNNEVVSLSSKEKFKWLHLNEEYLLELDSLIKKTAGNPLILEHVCALGVLSGDNDLKFKELIESQFEELTYDLSERVLSGSYCGESISLIVDSLFYKVAKRFMVLLSQNSGFIVYCKNKNSSDDKYDRMTIGEFLVLMGTQFNIQIDQRYKGLGEAQTTVLFTTTINPKTRKLIRLTMDELSNALEIFDILHGKNDLMREKRRQILEESNFKLSDIDN